MAERIIDQEDHLTRFTGRDYQELRVKWRGEGMQRGYANTPEGQIHYVTAGQGDPLILLHQACRSSRMYLRVIPLLAQMYRVVAIDTLGYGFSDAPSTEGDTMAILASSITHTMDALNMPKAHIFGLHTGAGVAAEVAGMYPDRVGVLMLMSYPLLETEEERQAIQEAGRDFGTAHWMTRPDGGHLMALWMRAYSDVLRELQMSPPPTEAFQKHPDSIIKRHYTPFSPTQMRDAHFFMTPEHLQFTDNFIADWFDCRGRQVAVRDYLRQRDTTARLPLVVAPTFYIEPDTRYGNHHLYMGNVIKEKYIRHCEVVTLKGGGDNVAEFDPPLFSNFIRDLLAKYPM